MQEISESGPGGAVGQIAISSEKAIEMAAKKKSVILVRKETNPDDLGGMLAAKGVLTQLGGRTSHAALIARQYGIPTICGCGVQSTARRPLLGISAGRKIRSRGKPRTRPRL